MDYLKLFFAVLTLVLLIGSVYLGYVVFAIIKVMLSPDKFED